MNVDTIAETTLDDHYIIPDRSIKYQKIYLTKSKSAWITITWLDDTLIAYARSNYDALFALHPSERGKVVLYDMEIASQRWHRSYLNTPERSEVHERRSYMYSGKKMFDDMSLPFLFHPFLDAINQGQLQDKYNQVTVNWYANGLDYIAPHSDCRLFMKPDAGIVILSLYKQEEDFRILCFKPKKHKMVENAPVYSLLKIAALQGSVITMCGDLQEVYRHYVPKNTTITTSRISITCRKF